MDAPDRVAVAVVRAWVESGAQNTLKVRITTARDVSEQCRTIGVTADIDDACAIIRSWLEQFANATVQSNDAGDR